MVYVLGSWLCSMNSTWPQDSAGDREDLWPLVWWCSDSMPHWMWQECSGCCNGCASWPGHKLDPSWLLAHPSWWFDLFAAQSWFVWCASWCLLVMPVSCILELRKQWCLSIAGAVSGHMMMSYWPELWTVLCNLCANAGWVFAPCAPLRFGFAVSQLRDDIREIVASQRYKGLKWISCTCPLGL